ncbi:RsmB/NOP family class I SAM-dependent RNA methyltransferase [Paenibacillus wynnii]|uniref:RsmB/NOP family class I SAM-dependent RNA methyltransferase n=1 Tax=Paenibacillus wynnii TaxID=268407 RepID=UPI002793A78F|nr:RsmB/NOP family class I SAM-dependent RNA methyltransferase [Paenibacillus wynnii]MDQ0195900.1 NOL1/NOP2/sun family putative RNA methylase [Paenibacillus wynnii]
MAVQLPHSFTERMKELLGTEYEQFANSYSEIPYGGIRANTLKITAEQLQEISPFQLEPIPWCPTGFYTPEGARPGKHPYYHAGLYYIQEPSAMAPVELLGVTPGDRVLDLCAAPGGKSTQIAAKLQGKGLLVSNDLHPERTKALAKNLELYGTRNGIVLNESPERIAAAFPAFFDRILIDAPCSGEGMFRKDEDMVKQWDSETPAKYAAMQQEILSSAAAALAPGGTLVYSTCTFAMEENEGSIAKFLSGHPQFSVVPVGGTGSFAEGFGELPGTARLWPHKVKGEGHFMAVLRHNGIPANQETDAEDIMKSGYTQQVKPEDRSREKKRQGSSVKLSPRQKNGGGKGGRPQGKSEGSNSRNLSALVEEEALAAYGQFVVEQLVFQPGGYPVFFGDHIYISPLPKEALDGLKTIRPGWYVGSMRNGRFIPGHPFATALRAEESRRSLSLSTENGEAVSYLKGETLTVPSERLVVTEGIPYKGYVLVCIDGYSAGWGKWQDGMLKNEYPAGWRWT